MGQDRFERDRILKLLNRAASKLEGRWLLVGGGAVAVWFGRDRTTEDLDLVSLPDTRDGRLQLLEFAHNEGIPVEALNSAADFFVRRIAGWDTDLTPLCESASSGFYLPSPTTFLLTKIARLSEVDLTDCLGLIDHVETSHARLDRKRVLAALDDLAPAETESLALRRGHLQERLRRLE